MNQMIKFKNRQGASHIILLFSLIFLGGCVTVNDVYESIIDMPKLIWGSSTRALELARVDAIAKEYNCSYDECFDFVLSLKRSDKARNLLNEKAQKTLGEDEEEKEDKEEEEEILVDDGQYDIFSKSRVKGIIVVLGISGSVQTTEVGIFLTEQDGDFIKFEITSHSSKAKQKVANAIFDGLDLLYAYR